MEKPDLTSKRVTVIGGKRSGIAAALLLKKYGADVFVTEKDALEKVKESAQGKKFIENLELHSIASEFGMHSEKALACEFAVISPGVPRSAQIVKSLMALNIPIYSEIELASWFCKARVIAITGTDGKTTTCALTQKIFENDGKKQGYKALALGNIGIPFSEKVHELREKDVAIVETSSFQLEHCQSYKPKVAVITNITPDHLDRYDNIFEHYAAAKYRVYQAQDQSDYLVVNIDNKELKRQFTTESVLKALKPTLVPLSLEKNLLTQFESCACLEEGWLTVQLNGKKEIIMKQDEVIGRMHFRGTHNVYNTLAAAVAARALEVKKSIIRESVMSFEGVAHRIEFIRTIGGVHFINDSKATTVNALWYALDTISAPIILIAGGRDKGNDYEKVKLLVKEKVKLVIALGESKETISDAFKGITTVVEVNTMDEAVQKANEAAQSGETVLLSPACASYDMYLNYEERGEAYKRLVAGL